MDVVIALDVPIREIIDRMSGRRRDGACHEECLVPEKRSKALAGKS
jgi:hypothetical protein